MKEIYCDMRYLQPLLFQDTAADFVPFSVPSQQPALLKNINSFNNNHRLVCVCSYCPT